MNKLTSIIIFSLLLLNTNQVFSNIKDTCVTKYKIDSRPEIVHQLYSSFSTSNFYNLTLFIDSRVEFVILDKNKTKKQIVTDYRVAEILTDFTKEVNYSQFRILSAENLKSEFTLLVELLIIEKDERFIMRIYFVLDDKNSIKTIVLQ